MKLGLFTSMFHDVPIERVCQRIAALGYETVEIPVWYGAPHLPLDKDASTRGREVQAQLRSVGLEIGALNNARGGQLVLGPHDASTDTWAPSTNPEAKIEFGIASMVRAAELAADLEIGIVVGFVGAPRWDKWYVYPTGNADLDDQQWQTFADRWGPILDHFHALGVRFAAEIHPMEMTHNLETTERAIEALGGHPAFAVNLDPSHLIWQSIDPVVVVKRLGSRIAHVHAKDCEVQEDEVRASGVLATGPWTRSNRGMRFRIPGWGQTPWRRLFTALAATGFIGSVSYEHEDPVIGREDACEKVAEFLRPLLIRQTMEATWW